MAFISSIHHVPVSVFIKWNAIRRTSFVLRNHIVSNIHNNIRTFMTMDPKVRLVSCDTFVVLPPLTHNNLVIFGKNSDRPAGEVQEIVHIPRKQYPSDSKIECTYISIDAPKESYSVILSKPSWMWGAEMGANEFGVCIGNEAIWTTLNSPEDMNEQLLGMDLVRLGLERGKTAKESLDVITNLLSKYGQGGPCSDTLTDFTYHNGFLIADAHEAWVLETAGKEWAAEKVESGVRNISNCLSIETKIDLMSNGLKSVAQEKGFWDGKGEFDFSRVYGTGSPDDRLIAGKGLLNKLSKDKSFDVKSMISVLRDEKSGICRGCDDPFPSVSSQVSAISATTSRPSCHWFTGTPDPDHSIFKPFIFCENIKLSSNIKSPVIDADPAKEKPRFKKSVDRRHVLYQMHEKCYPKLTSDSDDGKKLRETLKGLESSCIEEMEQMLDNYHDDGSLQIQELFNDVLDSELRFYK